MVFQKGRVLAQDDVQYLAGHSNLCLLFIHPRAPNLISLRSVLPQLSVGGQP